MSTSRSSGYASKVLVDSLLGGVEVAGLGLQAVRQVQGEAAMQLGLVIEGLVAALGLDPVVVLLDEALVDLPDGLLCGRLLKDGATQVQVIGCNHLQSRAGLAVGLKQTGCVHRQAM